MSGFYNKRYHSRTIRVDKGEDLKIRKFIQEYTSGIPVVTGLVKKI